MTDVKEMGKYRIWWLPAAPLVPNCVIYFERYRAERYDQRQTAKEIHLRLNLSPSHHYKMAVEKPLRPTRFEIKQSGNPETVEDFVAIMPGFNRLEMQWKWEGLDKNQLTLQGSVQNGKEKALTFPVQALQVEINALDYLQQVFPDWAPGRNRLRIAVKDLEMSTLLAFAKDFRFRDTLDFDSIEFKHVPLMPIDLPNATQWRDRLLEHALSANYLGQETWRTACEGIQGHPALLDFQLATPTPENFLDAHFGGIQPVSRGATFWHLAAPHDLFPTTNA